MGNAGIQWTDVVIILALVLIAIVIGIIGYRFFYNSPWIDAFYESSLMLTGIGPLTNPTTSGEKIFVALYAILCSLVIVGIIAYVIAQILQTT